MKKRAPARAKRSSAGTEGRRVLDWRKRLLAEGHSFHLVHLPPKLERELRIAAAQRDVKNLQDAFELAVRTWIKQPPG